MTVTASPRSREDILLLLAAMFVAYVPHLLRFSPVISAWCLTLWTYVAASRFHRLPSPTVSIRFLLTAIGFTGVFMTGNFSLDRESSVALLAVMAAVKPFEIRTFRDMMVSLYITYFLTISALFYSNSLVLTLYLFLSVLTTTVVLVHVNAGGGSLTGNARLAGRIMLQALPLMLVLFFLFPRLPGSLLGFRTKPVAMTGFSDRLSPGDVSSLALNNAVAFRIEFAGTVPPPQERYWRGLVFSLFDGTEWRYEQPPHEQSETFAKVPGVSLAYTVTLEAHHQHWLFALDMPVNSPDEGLLLDDGTIRAHRRVSRQVNYLVLSVVTDRWPAEYEELERNLVLPQSGNARSRSLGKRIAAEHPQLEQRLDALLRFFAFGGFAYSIEPPPLDSDFIDDFLFRTKKGYCEHYASAFTFLARTAGIPARVVGGYQGAEKNPYADYWIVRQSDAHAWSEVCVDGWQWKRVDPTSLVAPDRLTGGMRQSIPDDEKPLLFAMNSPIGKYLNQARFLWDVVNRQWSVWVTDYSYFRQERLLKKLGFRDNPWKSRIKALVAAIAIVIVLTALYAIRLLPTSLGKRDPMQAAWLKFCRIMARQGLPRPAAMGPLDYATMIIARRPDLTGPVRTITDYYIGDRYAEEGNREAEQKIRECLHSLGSTARKKP